MKIAGLRQVDACPKCGAMEGWLEKRICKYTQIFEADGEPFDAVGMTRVRGGDRKYCAQCSADITSCVREVPL
jgi:hypothetical protein